MTDWLDNLNRTGPKLIRLLARMDDGRAPISNREIGRRAGMSESRISQISNTDRWDRFTAKTISAFCSACGFDLSKPKTSIYRKLRRSKAYVKNLTSQQRRMIGRLQADVLNGMKSPD